MATIQELEQRIAKLEALLLPFALSDRYLFSKDIQLQDGRDIQLARARGTKIGTATDQKIGFWNATPVDQPTAIADAAGGASDSDGTARTKINNILSALREVGIIAT
jgi:hypothetical protein